MPPPTSSRSTLRQQVVDDAELVGDLRAAEHDDVRPLRVARSAGRSTSTSAATSSPAACGSRCGDVVDAGLLAVHDAEAVADVGVGERGELRRRRRRARRRPCSSRPGRSGGSRAARRRRRRGRRRSAGPTSPTVSVAKATGRPSSSREPRGDRREGVLRHPARPSGRPRCAHTTTRAPAVEQRARWSGRSPGSGRRR